MQWLVFGDDWGAHPSTTQHLVRHLPRHDRVTWVDSIGMRAPRLSPRDLRRCADKLQRVVPAAAPSGPRYSAPLTQVLSPVLLPWHDHIGARCFNARLLKRLLGDLRPDVILMSNPLASLYAERLGATTVYLRLDRYAELPGVDAAMVAPVDARLMETADLVAYTANGLAPPGRRDGLLLPQGVDAAHFGRLALEPPAPHRPVVGFFGLMAEWIDSALIVEVARHCPRWTFEFLGPRRCLDPALVDQPNVRLRDGVSYQELPEAIAHWHAAWIPFQVNAMTRGVNPLKLREYLAAGLSTASTALPAAQGLATIVERPDDVVAWLRESLADTAERRAARRALVAQDSWHARAESLRHRVLALRCKEAA